MLWMLVVPADARYFSPPQKTALVLKFIGLSNYKHFPTYLADPIHLHASRWMYRVPGFDCRYWMLYGGG